MILTRRYNVDRFGYLIPHRYGNLPMLGAVATFRPGEGRFGRGAVAVEEGTTNHIPSSRLKFEGWTAYQGAQVTVTQGYSIPGVTEGGATRIQTSGGDNTLKYFYSVGGDEGNPAAYSVWVYNIGQKTVRVWGNAISVAVDVAPGEVKRCTGAVRSLGPGQRHMQFRALDASDSLDFIAFQPQIETKPFATSFVDGTRAEGRLSYPVNFNMDEGTIRCYFYLNKTTVINSLTVYPSIFVARQGTGARNWLWVYFNQARTRLSFQRRINSGSESGGTIYLSDFDELSDGWHDVAIVWDHASGVIRAYLDGEFKGTATYDKNDLIPFDYIEVGYRQDGSSVSNLLFDELLILPYAASEEEIRAWYEADGPIPPHPAALLQWDWQAVRPATMVAL